MQNVETIENKKPATITGSRKVDVSRGEMRDDVSRQWASRPDDQRFESLSALLKATQKHAADCSEHVVKTSDLKVVADGDNGLVLEFEKHKTTPTNWSFNQLCGLGTVNAPARYLANLPAPLAADCLNHSIQSAGRDELMIYSNGEARAITSEKYGRIYDHEIVKAVRKIAGNGTGDARWKVPGKMDWSTMTYNPNVDVTKDTTTLFASDRDVFIFLVDDKNPIEVGKLENGDPDLMFRGFYVWNSEVGARSCGIATMYLRGVCQNRCLWGVEGFNEVSMKHTESAPDRFLTQSEPALLSYAETNTKKIVSAVKQAQGSIVASDDDTATDFLRRLLFTKPKCATILELHEQEEGRPARSVWDMAQGITAYARTIPHQNERIAIERKAQRILDAVA